MFLPSSCSGRKFTCTNETCDAVCGIYGDGHYVTFDDKRFDFSGQCEYTLLQVRLLKVKNENFVALVDLATHCCTIFLLQLFIVKLTLATVSCILFYQNRKRHINIFYQ